MLTRISIIILLLLSFQFSYAEIPYLSEGLVATSIDTSCPDNSADEYDFPSRIGSDSYENAGECLNTDQFRPAHIIENSEDNIVVANYRHQDQYWIAEIPKSTVFAKTYFQIIRFNIVTGITAAHVQFRSVTKEGQSIQLTSQTDSSVTSETNDIIVSFEASRPKEVGYNFALGSMPNYVLVGRILSGQQMLSEKSVNIEQYELNINEDQTQQLVITALQRSSDIKLNSYYNTLRPNCTTEVFDAIDTLTGVNSASPFLTVISGDPIAGPSIEALKERGILKARYADLKEDIEEGRSQAPEAITEPTASFLTQIPDYPYSMVIVTPQSTSSLDSAAEIAKREQIVEKAQQEVTKLIPGLVQSIGSSVMLGKDSSEILISTLSNVSDSLKDVLEQFAEDLPNRPINQMAYYIPWPMKAKPEERGELSDYLIDTAGIPAKLPFNTYVVSPRGNTPTYYFLGSGMSKVGEENYKNSTENSFHFQGVGVQLHLSKSLTKITLQIMGGLSNRDQQIEIVNDQVEFNKVVIPDAESAFTRPVFLASLVQELGKETPELKIEFGANGGVSPRQREFGQFQILESMQGCELQQKSVPTLRGVFGEKAHDNSLVSSILKGKDVNFGIFSVDIDLESQLISDMDIRISSFWPVRCMADGSVNEQFAGEANNKISEVKASLKEKMSAEGGAQLLIDQLLNNNTENVTSGY